MSHWRGQTGIKLAMAIRYEELLEFFLWGLEVFSRRDCGLILAGLRVCDSDRRANQLLSRLERQRLIERQQRGQHARFRITETGEAGCRDCSRHGCGPCRGTGDGGSSATTCPKRDERTAWRFGRRCTLGNSGCSSAACGCRLIPWSNCCAKLCRPKAFRNVSAVSSHVSCFFATTPKSWKLHGTFKRSDVVTIVTSNIRCRPPRRSARRATYGLWQTWRALNITRINSRSLSTRVCRVCSGQNPTTARRSRNATRKSALRSPGNSAS
jgi:hypothetical protein